MIGRAIVRVDAPDQWFLKGGLTGAHVREALVGRSFGADRRIGKLLLLDIVGGPTLGLRFGMTGRLIVDNEAAIARLEYGAAGDRSAWDRFGIVFVDGGSMVLRDPRRLGGVELDPDEGRLGPDALEVTPAQLRDILASSTAPLKARILDQSKLAGVGNLLADEMLWRAGLDPIRVSSSLTSAEVRRLHRHLRVTLDELMGRGGSHMGDLQDMRSPDGVCPKDGELLQRRVIGGRTTYSCPRHQR